LGVTEFQVRVLRGLMSFYSTRTKDGDNSAALVWASGEMIARRIGTSASNVYAALRHLSRPLGERKPRGKATQKIPAPGADKIAQKGEARGHATVYSLLPLHAALAAADVSDVFSEDRLVVGSSANDNASDGEV